MISSAPPRADAFAASPDALIARPKLWLAALFVMSLLTFLPGIGAQRPLDAHEAFVARTATEMARRGEWAMPWFNDAVRLQKPPLAYWLAMVVHRAAGQPPEDSVSEWEARLPSVIAAALLSVVTALLGWAALRSWRLGLISGALLATTHGLAIWSRSAQPEILYAFLCSVALLGFVLAARWTAEPGEARRARAATLLAWVGFALAVLAKGPLLPAFMLVGVVIGLATSRPRPRIALVIRPWTGLLIVALVVVPYFAWVATHADGAVAFWRAQMFERTGGVGEAWWRPLEMYYAVRALELLLPWSLLLPAAIFYFRLRRDRITSAERMVYFAALVPPVCLSFSAGRKDYYLLPVLGALAVLMVGAACELVRGWLGSERGSRRIGRILRAHAALGALAIVGLIVVLIGRRAWVPTSTISTIAACVAFAVALALCALAWREGGREVSRSRAVGSLFAAAACAFVAAAHSGLEWRVQRFTGGEFARDVARHAAPGRDLVLVEGDQQVLLYYTDHFVRRIDRSELAQVLDEPREKLFVDLESSLAQYGERRRVLVREKARPKDVPMVLIDPTGEAVVRGL